jgi:GNAT superfamily N-acetyltransferase
MSALDIVAAMPEDLTRYLDFLEEVSDWLESRGIKQWKRGMFRSSEEYFADSIERREVHLASIDGKLVGTLRLLLNDPIVWPDITENDAVYIYNLAVGRASAGQRLGARLLEWVEVQTASLGRRHIRLDCFAYNSFLCGYYTRAGYADRGVVDAIYPEPIGKLRLRRFEKSLPSDS